MLIKAQFHIVIKKYLRTLHHTLADGFVNSGANTSAVELALILDR